MVAVAVGLAVAAELETPVSVDVEAGGWALGLDTLFCVAEVSSWRFVWFKMQEVVKVFRFGV